MRLPPHQVPRTENELIEWLYKWWDQIDGWIERLYVDYTGAPVRRGRAHRRRGCR